jgi:hypothetical protein
MKILLRIAHAIMRHHPYDLQPFTIRDLENGYEPPKTIMCACGRKRVWDAQGIEYVSERQAILWGIEA